MSLLCFSLLLIINKINNNVAIKEPQTLSHSNSIGNAFVPSALPIQCIHMCVCGKRCVKEEVFLLTLETNQPTYVYKCEDVPANAIRRPESSVFADDAMFVITRPLPLFSLATNKKTPQKVNKLYNWSYTSLNVRLRHRRGAEEDTTPYRSTSC